MISLEKVIIIFRIAFLYYFGRELYLTQFKKKNNKLAWFFIVFIFGYYGYSIYIAFKRKFTVKRKFQPKFKLRENR